MDLAQQKEKLISEFRTKRKRYYIIGFALVFIFLILLYLGPFGGLDRFGFLGWRKGKDQASLAASGIGTALGPEYNIAPSSGTDRLAIAQQASTTSIDPEIQNLLDLINNYRKANNFGELSISPTLTDAAEWMANDLVTANRDCWDGEPGCHTDSLGRRLAQRLADFGYNYNTFAGENLAAGCTTGQCVFDTWRNSPGHNANMLGSEYVVVGLGKAHNDNPDPYYDWGWAAEFGGYFDGVPVSLDYFELYKPGTIKIGDTTGRYLWVIFRVRSLVDNDQSVRLRLEVSGVPSGCSQFQQLILPGDDTFNLVGNVEKWILYRERYECPRANPGTYTLNVRMTAATEQGTGDSTETQTSIQLQ